ncbi:MAG TPA: thioredoxin domain-containing protein, partial [Acidiphilium sp.]
DSEGEEGKFYVWTRQELIDALGAEFPAFEAHYPCPAGGNWEEKIILTRATHPENPAEDAHLAELRNRLLAVRSQRVRPGRDDKILADWNGLAIAALTRASAVFGRPDWLDAAKAAFRAVLALLGRDDGRFDHAFRRSRISASGMLDDQAAMLRAALALYQATGDADYLRRAESLAEATAQNFGDSTGGFFLTATDAGDLPGGMRPRGGFDGPTPSGAGLMAEGFSILYHLTGADHYRTQAESLIAAHAGERRALPAYPTLLAAAALLESAACVVIIGDRTDLRFAELHRAALSSPDPAVLILPVGNAAALPESHPAYGKTCDSPAAFVCHDRTCSLPVHTADALRAEISSRPGQA